jgi:hypothetical protein
MENESPSVSIKVVGIRDIQFSIDDNYEGSTADLKINLNATFNVDK